MTDLRERMKQKLIDCGWDEDKAEDEVRRMFDLDEEYGGYQDERIS